MNYYTWQNLLHYARTDWKIPRLASLNRVEHCCICLWERFKLCAQQHPNWFGKKNKRVHGSHREKVKQFLGDLPKRKCVVKHLAYFNDDFELEHHEYAYCARHLREAADELEKIDRMDRLGIDLSEVARLHPEIIQDERNHPKFETKEVNT